MHIIDPARANGGEGLTILSEPSSSMTYAALVSDLKISCPNASFRTWDPLSRDSELLGTQTAFGKSHRAVLDLEKAELIVSFDCDLFGDHPTAVQNAHAFASGRREYDPRTGENVSDELHMNQLVVYESTLTITGGMADQRVPDSPATIAASPFDASVTVYGASSISVPTSARLRPIKRLIECTVFSGLVIACRLAI